MAALLQPRDQDTLPAEVSGLDASLSATSPCRLRPLRFFVSWQGVLTVAYEGFPAALTDLKQRISAEWPVLPRENPGSLWPKTTLAALKDGRRLTPEQLVQLNTICRHCERTTWNHLCCPLAVGQTQLLQAGNTDGDLNSAGSDGIAVDSAAVVVFGCRSLEKVLSLHRVEFQGPPTEAASSVADSEKERVRLIVAEADHPEYWFAASKDGSRESHYRSLALGCTVMIPLADCLGHTPSGAPLLAAIREFKAAIDSSLPGMYAWLSETSYHVTLRGIIG